MKSGELIAKSRLCLKGFAEPISEGESNGSPTASRASHRVVCHTATQKRWPIASLDVSVAFLKGLSFEQLSVKGIERKPVAFVPCEEVWDILAELAPQKFAQAAKNPGAFVFVLRKAAYGLRDAPLMWHLRAIEILTGLEYVATKHDSCLFVKRNAKGEIIAMLTLHVDDLLMAATWEEIKLLEKNMSKVFGTLTLDVKKKFKHFGVDVSQKDDCSEIVASQASCISDLKPVEIPTRCNKQDKCPPPKITEYRALVSAIAWVGVTSPIALCMASLLQSCLPEPTYGDIVRLNDNLTKLHACYSPLIYRPIPES